jgi:hypothetical protein
VTVQQQQAGSGGWAAGPICRDTAVTEPVGDIMISAAVINAALSNGG